MAGGIRQRSIRLAATRRLGTIRTNSGFDGNDLEMVSVSPPPSFWSRARAKLQYFRHRIRFRTSVRLLHGPPAPNTPADAVIIVALVRNGSFYLDEFLQHYRGLGAAQFVFCDNGSSDGTIARLQGEPDTVVLQSRLPWGEIESDFRRYAAERYAPGRWCLFADMDEIFDFEGAGRIGLPGLTQYLTQHGYSAVVAQMLEMFPEASLSDAAGKPYRDVLSQFRYYDLGQIVEYDYHDGENIGFSYFLGNNTVASSDIKVCFGGIRHKVFDEMCCLTKHPLVHVTGAVQPGVHPHCAANVVCADFTALIRHYKFANDPFGRDADTINRKAIPHGEDQKRVAVFQQAPQLSLFSETAKTWAGVTTLYEQGFLVRSQDFSAHVAAQTPTKGR